MRAPIAGAEGGSPNSPMPTKGAKKASPFDRAILSLDLQPGWARPRKPTAAERESYGLPPEKPLAAQAGALLERYDTNHDGDT